MRRLCDQPAVLGRAPLRSRRAQRLSAPSTPASAAKCLAAILSKARCEDAEPDPVNGTPRISHIACSSPFSARPPCRPSTSTRPSLGPIQRLLDRSANALSAGLELLLERARMSAQRLRACLMHAVVGVPEPQIGLRQGLDSACALATETSRSLLVPPNKMVIRIIPAVACTFVITGATKSRTRYSPIVVMDSRARRASGMTPIVEPRSA